MNLQKAEYQNYFNDITPLTIYNDFKDDAQRIIKYLGLPEHYVGDILSEFYLKLHQMQQREQMSRLYFNDKINAPYLFSMISNLVYDFRKSENIYSTLNGYETEIPTLEKDIEIKEELVRFFLEEIEYDFDKELLRIYLFNGESMRDISKGSGISLTTIFHSLKRSKSYVKRKSENELKSMNIN